MDEDDHAEVEAQFPAGAAGAQCAAVWVRGARHQYRAAGLRGLPGARPEASAVLRGLDMTVRRGEVYALLGRSGCGKTTLLRALVGQHALDDGDVLVLGREPGDPAGGVPGSAVGYMPQEVALHDGLTVSETLGFQGRLVGLAAADIRAATDHLVALLELPAATVLVGKLSGGEKRRVSLAMALLHGPPLLILDEPTVGADPVLRHSIWQLLLAVADGGSTVVITTHYSEEARRAHTVGLLRQGRMAVEDNPAVILERLCGPAPGPASTSSAEVAVEVAAGDGVGDAATAPPPAMEAAVRRLCELLDARSAGEAGEAAALAVRRRSSCPACLPAAAGQRGHPEPAPLRLRHKLAALLWKNSVHLWRHSFSLATQAVFFVFITVLACVVLGHWPQGVRVDVVNEEANCTAEAAAPLSCDFLRRLPGRGLRPVLQPDEGAARASVRSGRSWGVLRFGAAFSPALVDRVVNGAEDDDTLDASEIHAHLDTTDFVISNMVTRRLAEVMGEVMGSISPSMTNLVRFEEPVFGRREPINIETFMPGVLLGYMTTFAASLIMSTLLTEKTDKFMERTLVTGVRMSEIMASWVAVLLPVVLVVNLVSHAFIFGPLAIPCAGSVALMYLLCSALCLMTMLAGLLFASMFNNYITAMLSCHQFAVSFIFLSGVLWPLPAMHWSLRWLALAMPWAHSMEAARAVLQRGWGLAHTTVWMGFASCAVWAAAFLAALVLVHRPARRRRRANGERDTDTSPPPPTPTRR